MSALDIEINDSASFLEGYYGGKFAPLSNSLGDNNNGPEAMLMVESILTESGPGAKAILGGDPLIAMPGDKGHVWNAVNLNGNVHIVDGQFGGSGVGNFDKLCNFQILITQAGAGHP